LVQRGANSLRTAMLTQVAGSNVAIIEEDEKVAQLQKRDNMNDWEIDFKSKNWETLVTETPGFHKHVRERVDAEFSKDIDKIFKSRKERRRRKAKKKLQAAMKEEENNREFKQSSGCCSEWLTKRAEWKKRGKELIQRGGFRDYSRIWWKDCPKEQM